MAVLVAQFLHPLNWLGVFVGVLLVGCAATPSVFVPVSPSAENASVVYIYRPVKAANVMLSPQVSIAGSNTFEINNGEYKQLELPPGMHVIRLAATEGNTPVVEHELEVVPQQVYFLRIEASMKMQVGQTYQPYRRKFELERVSAEKALAEIAACADVDGRTQLKQTKVMVDGGDEAVFSVDKTANPFSR